MSAVSSFRPRPWLTRMSLAASVAAAGGVLVSCATAEPHTDVVAERLDPVTIAVRDDAPQLQVMAEIYAQALGKADREASVLLVDDDLLPVNMVDGVAAQRLDFVVGCTGDFLLQANPVHARGLADRAEGNDGQVDPNDPSFHVEVFEAFRQSLPAGTMSIDPSSAEACRGSEVAEELPQQVLPVFRSSLFNRDELIALDIYTKLITTEELAQLTEEAEDADSVPAVVGEWMGQNDAGEALNGDTDSSEGDSDFGIGEQVPQ